ncbi:hypothetical protein C5167_000786 [Papaver somniferum]|uniref:Bulb-type lectin domain-containing protein n=1 Tax=Papaver somniferum TaxID=3469 RepID=A0A4Y7KXM9_PAPSO|nr:hypothetical protein C5167_000786 [Papaver somniferum]
MASLNFIDSPHQLSYYPFGLYFYNITPNAFFLGIGVPIPQQSDAYYIGRNQIHLVWDANLNDPVRENATLTFGRDGNFVLTDADGRIVWQTNTANKGVTGISMKANGNLVLHDKKGRFIWQSFQHPTDTLLPGQSLQLKGSSTKLVSRTSNWDNGDDPHSMKIDVQKGLIMYQKHSGKLVPYAGWKTMGLLNVTFRSVQRINPVQEPPPEDIPGPGKPGPFYVLKQGTTTYFLTLGFTNQTRRVMLKKNDKTFTYSFLRLDSDGNLRLYIYAEHAWEEIYYRYWEAPYAFFGDTVKECALGSKCGTSGKCDRRLCSACPRSGGSLPDPYDYTVREVRWVWGANLNDPVHENATLTFSRDGNLVLGHAYEKGRLIWQSFQHPTDTLLVGQSLHLKGTGTKLVSRTSNKDSRDGWKIFDPVQDTRRLLERPTGNTTYFLTLGYANRTRIVLLMKLDEV